MCKKRGSTHSSVIIRHGYCPFVETTHKINHLVLKKDFGLVHKHVKLQETLMPQNTRIIMSTDNVNKKGNIHNNYGNVHNTVNVENSGEVQNTVSIHNSCNVHTTVSVHNSGPSVFRTVD